MPVVKQEFKIDCFQLQHSRDPNALRHAHFEESSRELGRRIVELFPYVRNEEASFHGELPEMVMTKDSHFVERWGVDLVVMKTSDLDAMLQTHPEFEPLINHLKTT